MQALNNNQTSPSELREAVSDTYATAANSKVQRKVAICHYRETITEDWGHFMVFPFALNGKTYLFVDKASGCDSVSESDDVILDFDIASRTKKDTEILKRLSDIMTKGFRNVCTVLDIDKKSTTEGVCHDFAHYLSFGFSVLDSSKYKKDDSFYDSIPSVKITPFAGEEHLKLGDIVQITCLSLCDGHEPTPSHSMVFIGEGKYISKHAGDDIYIQDLDSILNTFKDWKEGTLRVVRDVST